jgi:hypothetical protein
MTYTDEQIRTELLKFASLAKKQNIKYGWPEEYTLNKLLEVWGPVNAAYEKIKKHQKEVNY